MFLNLHLFAEKLKENISLKNKKLTKKNFLPEVHLHGH